MEITVKAYYGTFIKRNGQPREMVFAQLQDLPDSFLEEQIIGTGIDKQYPEGMQLVWDLEEDYFRVFNWSTVQGPVQEIAIEDCF